MHQAQTDGAPEARRTREEEEVATEDVQDLLRLGRTHLEEMPGPDHRHRGLENTQDPLFGHDRLFQ